MGWLAVYSDSNHAALISAIERHFIAVFRVGSIVVVETHCASSNGNSDAGLTQSRSSITYTRIFVTGRRENMTNGVSRPL